MPLSPPCASRRHAPLAHLRRHAPHPRRQVMAAQGSGAAKVVHFLAATDTRLYKDGDEWKTSTSFGREELPLVAKIADMAHTWIYQQGQESNGDSHHNNGDSR